MDFEIRAIIAFNPAPHRVVLVDICSCAHLAGRSAKVYIYILQSLVNALVITAGNFYGNLKIN